MKSAALVLIVGLAAGAAASGAETSTVEQARRVVGEPRGQALEGEALRAATEATASVLRCPVCQGLSVADSPTGLAQSMKAQTSELLAAGYTHDQALAYFEASYGEFVRLDPPRRGVNWLVWLAPAAGLLLGGAVVARALHRTPAAEAPAQAVVTTVDPDLEPYLRLVREAAYGWPGGERPGGEAAQ